MCAVLYAHGFVCQWINLKARSNLSDMIVEYSIDDRKAKSRAIDEHTIDQKTARGRITKGP